jgi:hypothetical protein
LYFEAAGFAMTIGDWSAQDVGWNFLHQQGFILLTEDA